MLPLLLLAGVAAVLIHRMPNGASPVTATVEPIGGTPQLATSPPIVPDPFLTTQADRLRREQEAARGNDDAWIAPMDSSELPKEGAVYSATEPNVQRYYVEPIEGDDWRVEAAKRYAEQVVGAIL